MKINEFIDAINDVAYACRKDGLIYICAYRCLESKDWLLKLAPSSDELIESCDWDCAYGISFDELRIVLSLVKQLQDTPVKERFPEKKYTVQIIKGVKFGYLNMGVDDNEFFVDTKTNTKPDRTHFTQSEIDKLKQRDDIAIDWNKAIIEEVPDNAC